MQQRRYYPDYESQLIDDVHMMEHLKEVNIFESKLLNNLRDCLRLHSIPFNSCGHTGEINERINLNDLRTGAQNDKIKHQQALREARYHNEEIKEHRRNQLVIDEKNIISEIVECDRIIMVIDAIERELVN